jgi:hypothetical protein
MKSGIQMAREAGNELHADVLDAMKDQLIIVLMKRLAIANCVTIPVAELDDTGQDLLAMSLQGMGTANPVFEFELSKKS